MITTKDIIRVKLKEYTCYMDKAKSYIAKADLVLDSIRRMTDETVKPEKYTVSWMEPGVCRKGGTKHLAYYPNEESRRWRCDDPSCHRKDCPFFWRRTCDECLGDNPRSWGKNLGHGVGT